MVQIATSLNIGNRDNLTPDVLLEIIEKMYIELAEAVNSKPDLYERDVDGKTTDTFLANGAININTVTNKVEMLTEHVDTETVIWTILS